MSNHTVPIHHYTKKRTHYGPVSRWLGRTVLRLLGWRLVGERPDVPKCVVACAPHTSNWDFFYTLLAAWALNVPCVFMIKDTLFWWPLGVVLRWLGGIPINRTVPEGIVEQMAHVIRESEKINVVITPEGTRKGAQYWKLGFYRIAVAAAVPVLFGVMNYKEQWVGVADVFHPTGDLDADWAHITEVFERTVGVTPKRRPPDAGEAAAGHEKERRA
ncbi:MAG TPA: lysophospholipid acyltransferase family protein [Candidatus Hydrogenedentes bacterium]|nr:lysophospholipid acyltransferase family protein [Candidatus Hydrogenedentota bacterium]HNT89092.1 lysophospholipid acyltransferase family protein [Candidatus Hydrogenedentota bacterium]